MNPLHPLHALNLDIARLEGARDRDALSPRLHEALVFQRADGSVVDRDAYLTSLDNIVSLDWVQTVILDLRLHGEDLAVVHCLVAVDRVQSDKKDPVKGVFLNVRVWTRATGDWQIIGWFNTSAKGLNLLDRA